MHHPLRPSQIVKKPVKNVQPIRAQFTGIGDSGRLSQNIGGKLKRVEIVRISPNTTTKVPSLILAALPLASILHSKAIMHP